MKFFKEWMKMARLGWDNAGYAGLCYVLAAYPVKSMALNIELMSAANRAKAKDPLMECTRCKKQFPKPAVSSELYYDYEHRWIMSYFCGPCSDLRLVNGVQMEVTKVTKYDDPVN